MKKKDYWNQLINEASETVDKNPPKKPAPPKQPMTNQDRLNDARNKMSWSQSTFGPDPVICPNPNCGFVGIPARVGKGSILAGCCLLCFFIIPGIVYFLTVNITITVRIVEFKLGPTEYPTI